MPTARSSASSGPEHGDHAGQQLAEHLGAADPEAVDGHVVRGDAALGDDPGGPGVERGADDLGDRARDLAAAVVEPAAACSVRLV